MTVNKILFEELLKFLTRAPPGTSGGQSGRELRGPAAGLSSHVALEEAAWMEIKKKWKAPLTKTVESDRTNC